MPVGSDYASRFEAWWMALQPPWRTPDGLLSRAVPAKEAWTLLKKGGSAGFYVVVMALSWWISTLPVDEHGSRAWVIVDDVTWVLSKITPIMPPIIESTSIKRPLSEPPANNSDEADGPPAK